MSETSPEIIETPGQGHWIHTDPRAETSPEIIETPGQGTYEAVEGTAPHPEHRHEPRTFVHRNEGVVHMMSEIDDGVFVAWTKCDSCQRPVVDCTCPDGPVPAAFMREWLDKRFEQSLRWSSKLVAQGEAKVKAAAGWMVAETRDGDTDVEHSDGTTVLEIDWDDIGDDWANAEQALGNLDDVAADLPEHHVTRIRELIEEVWPEEAAERRLRLEHPDMETPVKCKTCGEVYDESSGDGYCGECPECADKSEPTYDDEPDVDDERDHAETEPGQSGHVPVDPAKYDERDLSTIDPGF